MSRWADEEQTPPELGVPFRRTPGSWSGNRVMHALIDAGWKVWTVVDRVREDVAHYEDCWEDPSEPFSASSYALGYFNACIAIGRGQRERDAAAR